MEDTRKMMEMIYSKLDNFLKTETVVGEPIQVGSVKLVPIITASFGLGGGIGEEKEGKGGESGGAGGGVGCRISPNAILVIKDDEVELVTLEGKGSLDKLFEMLPELVSKLDFLKDKKKKNDEDDETEAEAAESQEEETETSSY